MEEGVIIIVNSHEYICNKNFIMEKSPIVRKYFENNPKESNFICNIDSFQGNESILNDFLNEKQITVTYDIIPFITSLSKVFNLNCFDDQLTNLKKSFQNIIKNVDTHFSSFETNSNLVLNESFESISQELSQENFIFFARSFLSLCILNPLNISDYKAFLKEEEEVNNIPIYQELEKLLKMKHFLFRIRDRFLSIFHSPLFLKNLDSKIEFEIIEKKHKDENKTENNSYYNNIDKIYSIIENDDVDSLQKIVSNPEFDINSRFYDVTLIEYSAFLSSVVCFKFLLNNHALIGDQTINFAIAGGNAEIIHICEQRGCLFDETLEIAAAFNHQQLIIWLLETKNQKINEKVIENCFLFSNFSFLNQIITDEKIKLNDLLIYSAEFCQFTLFKWISSLPGIDIDHKNSKGFTSLHFGCLNDDFQLVEFILNCPLSQLVNINSKIIHEDISPLHIACQNNNVEIAKLLLSHPRIDVNSQTFYTNRMTPLHIACKFGNYEIVELLLKNKSIQINAITYSHKTPFYYACKNGFTNIVKLLIQHNANTSIANNKNSTSPILIAGIHDHFDIVRLIVSPENANDTTKLGETLILLSSKSGDVEMAKLLKLYKANILAKNQKGLNALHYSCKGKDSKEMINFLIENGCNYKEETRNILINLFFICCKIPLHYACKHGNFEQVCYLLKYEPELLSKKDGNIPIQNFNRNNPFHYAILNGNYELIDFLMDYTQYFKINKKDSSSNTALHEAVIKKDPNIVLCLLKKGKADVNSRNRISSINFHKVLKY